MHVLPVSQTTFQVSESMDKLPSGSSKDIEYMEALMSEIKRGRVRPIAYIYRGGG